MWTTGRFISLSHRCSRCFSRGRVEYIVESLELDRNAFLCGLNNGLLGYVGGSVDREGRGSGIVHEAVDALLR
jgi:hypothetical protein